MMVIMNILTQLSALFFLLLPDLGQAVYAFA
jgi:hypothetical protein